MYHFPLQDLLILCSLLVVLQGLSLPPSQLSRKEIVYLKHSFPQKMTKCLWKRWLLGILPVISLTLTVVLLVTYYTLCKFHFLNLIFNKHLKVAVQTDHFNIAF